MDFKIHFHERASSLDVPLHSFVISYNQDVGQSQSPPIAIKMTRTVPLIRTSVRPTKGSVDLFNVLDFEPPIQDKKGDSPLPPPPKLLDDDDVAGQELMEFYRDSVLLITGGTGFLGRVLLQKLLRTFPVKRIYLLVRKKNTQSVEERMDDFYQDVVCSVVLPRTQ